MITDLSSLRDGDVVLLRPKPGNPLHRQPVKAMFQSGYFYCVGTDPMDGPDYYWRDVLVHNDIEAVEEAQA